MIEMKIQGHAVKVNAGYAPILALFTWRLRTTGGQNKYAVTTFPKAFETKKQIFSMHELVMYWLRGKKRMPGLQIDHIDGNGLNNTVENLRLATSGQNRRNMKKQPGKTSKYKGVYWNKQRKYWGACLKINGKHINLGSFQDENIAALAYNEAARIHHKQFARLNEVSQ